MGNYNPHAPYIIGNEWVPIRQANFAPDKVTESGYSFHIDHSATPITGAYYVAEVPQTRVNNVSDMIHVYRAGDEILTGPIKQIAIPVSAIWVTGAAINSSAGFAALQNPSDGRSIRFTGPSDFNTSLGISFDVPSYSQQLFGKRILDVTFRYSIAAHDVVDIEDVSTRVGFAKDMNGFGFSVMFQKLEGTFATGNEPTSISSFSLGSTNYLWDSTRDPYTVHDVYPWRYQELARFAATEAAPTRMMLRFSNQLASSNNLFFDFVDMLVTYCEETRILYGGRSTTSSQDPLGTVTQSNYEVGPNLVRMFNTSFVSNSTALTPGDYTVTLSHDDWPIDLIGAPKVSALRELYQVAPQRGLRVNRSLIVDEEFSRDDIPVLTELTLHTTAAIVTGTHPYGTQDDVPVYGTITAIQEIEDDPVGTSKSFPQVRFYARRFGDTSAALTLVDVATGLSTVSISVEDFDALPEIVDGWREVNLRFAVPPSFATAAGDVDWRWQAPNELSRNQWQVLGAGSTAFAAHSIGPASYYAPVGNTVTLTWQSPVISGTADDTLSDATLIFSTDTPTVSGFAITTQAQELTGITTNCIVPPRCVPTGIDYLRLAWDLPAGISCDTFTDRTVVASWGDTETGIGQSWTSSAPAAQWNVANGVGTSQPSTNNADRFSVVTTNSIDNSVLMSFSISALPSSGSLYVGAVPRYIDGDNHYIGRVQIASTGLVTVAVTRRVATVGATVASVATTLTAVPGEQYKIRSQAVNGLIAVKVWPSWQEEPVAWTLTATDTNITTGSRVGVFVRNESGVTTQVFSFDDFYAVPFQLLDGRYEIQRMDELDDDWQTIVDTTDLCITEFHDYEARVGIETDYRIRLCNALDFCTDTWATASGEVFEPGVIVEGDGNSVLIFTSNENPDANLAYVMQWEGQPIESFAFPEADEVQLQRMYGKDFFTAFHPLERGGEQFTRAILVNAAAIPAPSLANFRGLRDLAWAELNYVCVRDELGNRWFASVVVPESNVRMNRTIYMAQIEVSEVTGTPTPIFEVP